MDQPAEQNRVQHLEEQVMFMERHVDELNRALIDLGERLEAQTRRITTLEKRLEALTSDEDAGSADFEE